MATHSMTLLKTMVTISGRFVKHWRTKSSWLIPLESVGVARTDLLSFIPHWANVIQHSQRWIRSYLQWKQNSRYLNSLSLMSALDRWWSFRCSAITTSPSETISEHKVSPRTISLLFKVKSNSCRLHHEFAKRTFLQGCYADFSADAEDQSSFGNSKWNVFTSKAYVLKSEMNHHWIEIFSAGNTYLRNRQRPVRIEV